MDEILGYAGISPQSSQPSRLRSPYECTSSTSLPTDTTAKQRTTARLYSQSPHDGTPPTGPGGVSVGSVGVCGTVAGRGLVTQRLREMRGHLPMSMFVSDGDERVNPNGGWLRYSASAISNTPPIGHMRRRTSLTSVTSSIRPQCAPSGGFSWLG